MSILGRNLGRSSRQWTKYLLETAHALHVFLTIGPAALVNRVLSHQRCEAVRSGGTRSQPYNFLVLGLSLSLLGDWGLGAPGKGYKAQHDRHSHHGTLGGSSLCLTIVMVHMHGQRIPVAEHGYNG